MVFNGHGLATSSKLSNNGMYYFHVCSDIFAQFATITTVKSAWRCVEA